MDVENREEKEIERSYVYSPGGEIFERWTLPVFEIECQLKNPMAHGDYTSKEAPSRKTVLREA